MTIAEAGESAGTAAGRPPRRAVDGLFLLDKPCGITSNAALQRVKRAFHARKAGHAGTLDPLASGLLPICLGEATKFSSLLLDAEKSYLATVRLGITTTTGDSEGVVTAQHPVSLGPGELVAVLAEFVGTCEQTPPMYSALKHQGRPLYEYARRGENVERASRRIEIHGITLQEQEPERFSIQVRCSKGTYIRTLAEDIGARLGCGASLAALRRTAVGRLNVAAACTLETLEALPEDDRLACLQPLDAAVASLPREVLPEAVAARVIRGIAVPGCASGIPGPVALYRDDGALLGVGFRSDDGLVAPRRLLAATDGGGR